MATRAIVVTLLLSLAAAVPVAAQEICVTCAGPDAIYRCTIEKSEKITARLGNLADKPMQTVCMKELARLGGHERCAVRREAVNAPCPGIEKQLSLSSLLDNLPGQKPASDTTVPGSAGGEGSAASVPPVPAPAPTETKGPPRTVEELAKQTGAKSKEQLAKTWKCLTSLFSNC